MDEKSTKIRDFWDARAERWGPAWQATLGERWLRMAEIKTILKHIRKRKPRRVLDVGCGNGFSTKRYARRYPSIKFVGVDFSERMISYAKEEEINNCQFYTGNVLDPQSLPEGEFDIVTTQRCLQNLPDYPAQAKGIHHLRQKLRPGGVLLLIECSMDGVAQLNRLRKRLGMKPREHIMPWHNSFFRDADLVNDFGAKIEFFSSTYMFMAKVLPLHPKLWVTGYLLPPVGRFGYDRLYIIE